MDPADFPTIEEANAIAEQKHSDSDNSAGLGASWAQVVKEDEQTKKKVDHRPHAWEATKHNASFADIAKHELVQNQEFPTLEAANADSQKESVPKSAGVGELLNKDKETVADPTIPPHPDRSFATVASNKEFPSLETTTQFTKDTKDNGANETHESLSDLPDVKDMLNEPSVHVPPPPVAKSFAKIAAKKPVVPEEEEPVSERKKAFLKAQKDIPEESSLDMTHENFPTLSQSTLMTQSNASTTGEDKELFTEISRLHEAAEIVEVEGKPTLHKRQSTHKGGVSVESSFADITSTHGGEIPSVYNKVDKLPTYDEDTMMRESKRAEERKLKNGSEKDEKIEKTVQAEEKTENAKSRDVQHPSNKVSPSEGVEDEAKALEMRLSFFDKQERGKITMWDTFTSLRGLGYSLLCAIPATVVMHLRLSPLTSPHGFPFIYRSLKDLLTLPIYTKKVAQALTYSTPMLDQNKDEVSSMMQVYGHKIKNSDIVGLSFWDGFKAMRASEKTLRWWQFKQWGIHRLQWILTYTMLHDPKTMLVTQPTLVSLHQELTH
ncbi:hypothetical protein BDF14DRAFT_1716026 [Spinellus fusiger]|nr:hypothetical protein BDF14DRAFT_1716026 [Spinellus fusiger]